MPRTSWAAALATTLLTIPLACGGATYTLAGPDGAAGDTSSSGSGTGSSGSTSGGGGNSSGAGSSGTSGSSGSGGSGGSGSGGAASSGATSGGGGSTGSSSGGGSCTTDTQCSSSGICGFRTADGCAATGSCFPAPGAVCQAFSPACACDGSSVNAVCNGLPTGYATKPVLHSGDCQHLEAGAACMSDTQCTPGLKCCYPCGVPGCNNKCTMPTTSGGCPLIP